VLVNFVFYGHQGWVLGDIASQIANHSNMDFVRSELPVDADVYHILRPNWAAERGLSIPHPCVVSHHGQGIRNGNLMYGNATMDVFRDADIIAVLNTSDIGELAQAGVDCDKCRYIPHGVDIERFYPAPLEVKHKRCRVLRVGKRYLPNGTRDTPFSMENKGAATFCEIIELLDPERFEVVLLAGGDDTWEVETSVAESNGLVCTVMDLAYEDYPQVYRSCDVYLITSRSEGGPASLLEAMASGLPVVTTPTGMAKDMVVDGSTGIFYRFNDPKGAVSALNDIADGGWWGSKPQIASSRTMSLPFTWRNIAARYSSVYRELSAPLHYTSVRTWYGGNPARTRCLSKKEMNSPLYSTLRGEWMLKGKGFFRDWEYPAALVEMSNTNIDIDTAKILVVGANNDLLALSLCRTFGENVTCVDPIGFTEAWWFESPSKTIVNDPPNGLVTTWPDGPCYICSDIQRAQLTPESFDIGVSISVLEHVPNRRAFMEAFAKAIRPGGRLVMTVEYSPGGEEHIPELKLTTVGRRSLEDMAAQCGLRFVGGCDWTTREGSTTLADALPHHLRERFEGGRIPYFTPLITTMEKESNG